MTEKLKELFEPICKGSYTKEQKNYVIKCWEQTFNRKYKRCKCQLCDALMEIIKANKMNTFKYRIKKGICLVDHSDPTKMLNCKTQRDDLAIHHLRLNAANIRYFDIYPDNWKEDIYGKKLNKPKPEPTIEPIIEKEAIPLNEIEVIEPYKVEEKPKKVRKAAKK